MNNKGFSRLEFIVVFAILVVITYFAIPIFAKIYANSKKNAFEIEVKDIYRNLESTYYDSSLTSSNKIVELGSGSCTNKIKYNENDSLRYFIKMNDGKVVEYKMTNGIYALSYDPATDGNIKDISATMLVGRSSPYTFLYGTCAADIKDSKPFEVTFNSNGGTGGQTEIALATYQEDMPSINTSKPVKNGYTFLGWYDNTDYTKGVQYYNSNCKSSIKYNLENDVTLYAGWVKEVDDRKLYTILEKESSLGAYAKEYVGTHKDVLDNTGEYKIHYFYATNSVASSVINNNKRNVLIGNTCFQILRTTDSGGVKLIYNGEASVDKKCNNKRTHNGILAKGAYDTFDPGNYAVSDTFEYDLKSGKFKLNGNVSVMNVTTTNLTNGKYSCLSNNKNSTCTKIYFIVSYDNKLYRYPYVINNTHYSIIGTTAFNYASNSLGGAGYMTNKHYGSITKVLSKIGDVVNNNDTMYLSASIIKNNDGTYSLENSSLISTNGEKWKKDYTLYKGYYYCDGFSEKTCSKDKLHYIVTPSASGGQVYINKYDFENYVFGKTYTYENGKYTLNNNKNIDDWINDHENLNDYKYTCLSTNNECDKLYYVLGTTISSISYLTLANGKGIEDLSNDMLNNNVNKNDSIIKKYIENWYYNNMVKYSSILEDPIYCSDRDISIKNEFNLNQNDSLVCKNITDNFNTSNSSAKTKYPVSLMTGNESKLFGDSTIMKTGASYWIDADYSYDILARRGIISKDGNIIKSGVNDYYGVRPIISLKKDIKYISGNGNVDSPYIIDVN